MLAAFGATESQQSILRQLPSIAALLVIFLASALGRRWGAQRLIFASALLFTVGNFVIAAAPVLPVATLGLVCESAACSAMAVVGLGLLSARVSDPDARATVFATMAMVAPVVYMVMPVVAGVMLDDVSWRYVPVIWALFGIVMVWAARTLLPGDDERQAVELLTPALAGLTLAAVVQTVTAINHSGWLSSQAAIRFGVACVSAVLLWWLFRRTAHPSISLAALGSGGMLVLLVVVVVVPFVNLWYYLTVGYQYVFGLSATQTALVMIPSQLAGLLGAMLSRRLIQSRGITFTGVSLLLVLAFSLLTTVFIYVSSPVWLLVVIMSLYAVASVGASVPVTNSIMNTAPPGEENSASAFRGAASHVGSALGIVVMTAIVLSTVSGSLTATLGDEGLANGQSAQLAETLRDGSTEQEASTTYSVPLSQVQEVDEAQKAAMIDGLHAQGYAGAAFIALAALVFLLGRRRQVPKAGM